MIARDTRAIVPRPSHMSALSSASGRRTHAMCWRRPRFGRQRRRRWMNFGDGADRRVGITVPGLGEWRGEQCRQRGNKA
ncbi:MAG: hypothetical protein FJX52_07730 [Alphaproteobacteria bacterium]|nr:hypothetical protein [Alphaproteobacteria bacterium]